MFKYLLILPIIVGVPAAGFAQFVDKGEYVEVSKGTTTKERRYDEED